MTYSDVENDAPSAVSVVVDSTPYPLTSSDATYTDGAQFTSAALTFPAGVHSYYFRATQGGNLINTGTLNFYVTQSAAGHDLTLFLLNSSNSSPKPGTSLNVYAQIVNNGSVTETGVTANVQVTGPGYTNSQNVNIGTLVSGGIWGGPSTTLWTWAIPSNASGEYFIQVTVVSTIGDQNPSDNTRTISVYVSNNGPLASVAYLYRLYNLNWNASPGIPGWGGGRSVPPP